MPSKRKRPLLPTGPQALAQLRADVSNNPDMAAAVSATRDSIVADRGGAETIPAVVAAVIDKFCFLNALLSVWQVQISADPTGPAAGELVGKYCQAINTCTGLLKIIGVERRKKSMDLRTYAAQRTA